MRIPEGRTISFVGPFAGLKLKAPSRRKQRLIKPGLQLKSAFTFLGLAVTFLFIQALLLMQTLTEVAGTLPNEGALVLDGLPRALATHVLLMAGVMVPLFQYVGVRLTFRVAGGWSEDDRWVYPPPGRLGIHLDRDDHSLVATVSPDSPASEAGLEIRDRLLRSGAQRLSTSSDLSWLLHDFPAEGGTLDLDLGPDTFAFEVSYLLT